MVSPISKHFQLLSSMKRFAWISGIVMLCYVGENGQLRTSTWIIIVQTPLKSLYLRSAHEMGLGLKNQSMNKRQVRQASVL